MRPLSVFFKLALIVVTLPVLHCQAFPHHVIYQAVTHQLFDCNAASCDPSEHSNFYDTAHKKLHAYWGRDLSRIEKQVSISAASALR